MRLKGKYFDQIEKAIANRESLIFEKLWNSPKAYIVALTATITHKNVLVITPGSQEEARLFFDFSHFFDVDVQLFPAWEALPSEEIAPSPDIVGERCSVVAKLKKATRPMIVLASLQSALQKLLPPETFAASTLTVELMQTLHREEFIKRLQELGYKKEPLVFDKGQWAERGAILDLFPVSSQEPFRLEWDEERVISIRSFDPVSQKSVRKEVKIELHLADEMEKMRKCEKLSTLLDFFDKESTIFFDDIYQMEEKWVHLKKMVKGPSRLFMDPADLFEQAKAYPNFFFADEPLDALFEGGWRSDHRFELFSTTFQARPQLTPFEGVHDYLFEEGDPFSADLLLEKMAALEGWNCEVVYQQESEKEMVEKKMAAFARRAMISFSPGYLSSGFLLPDQKYLLLPTTEIHGRMKIRRQIQRVYTHSEGRDSFLPEAGEAIVHLNHGIGRFIGMDKRLDIHNQMQEFFLLEYAEKARLFVPLDQAHLLSRYVGVTVQTPTLHTLGSPKWQRQKEKSQQAIVSYANDLVQLYAERELKGGFSFHEDSELLRAFEEEFPYIETEDQIKAISEIKADMVSKKAMDRLICGDVGYGKTEVAMRAAFKAVVDGQKQVVVLVPTTVLALQHYESFSARMANFPVRIGCLSRFSTAKEVRETLQGLKEGFIDIVIGTSRLLSKDIVLKDLGLLIIDEEQRFGVKAKELLKQKKVGVDCITLTATPIPRTLYLSLIGARDLSTIHTPPQDRLPTTSLLVESQEETIKGACIRELARDGQIFFIHNRIETIYESATKLKKLLPEVVVAVVHGQMDAEEIDTVFHGFKRGEIEILVATSLVENGIDIPNANTIFIDRADLFGLADLYQLRGRVGRWNRRAYAYFLVKNIARLPHLSRKRLEAFASASGYGAGMKLALQDLEIRGMGDILGYEQSGHVTQIGFDLWRKLLQKAVKALQGKKELLFFEVKMEVEKKGSIPSFYIQEDSIRIDLYQRLGDASSLEEISSLFEEIQDRFGPYPDEVKWLLALSKIRIHLMKRGIVLLKQQAATITIEKKRGKEKELRQFLFRAPKDPVAFEEELVKKLI